jgi:DNA-binding NarL/FixJ family response regulator
MAGSATHMAAPLRILVCEDDDKLASLVIETLAADIRFDVVGRARDGESAVALAGEHSPDVVLMDIGMPGLDGIEATRAIHANDRAQHVVIYTGSGDYADVARAEDAGATGFLHKDALNSPDIADALHVLHTNYVSGLTHPE